MLNMETNLEGYLVGIGIRRVDGTLDFEWLDEPVHNTIVNSGIEHLLRYNGKNDKILGFGNGGSYAALKSPFFYKGRNSSGSPNISHHGIFSYMAIGTGTNSTALDMTELENSIQDSNGNTYIRSVVRGTPYTGSLIPNGYLTKARITHNSVAVTKTTTVTEFGLFGKTSDGYVMFSRIVIPEKNRITLQEGERAVLTYELNLKTNSSALDIGNINLYNIDKENMEICAEVGPSRNYYRRGTGYSSQARVTPNVTTGGEDSDGDNNIHFISRNLPWCPFIYDFAYSGIQEWNTNTWYNVCNGRLSTTSHSLCFDNYTDCFTDYNISPNNDTFYFQCKVDDYVEGSFERTYHFRITNKTANSYNVKFASFMGFDYKFYKMVDGTKTYTGFNFGEGDILELDFKTSFKALNKSAQ